MVLQWGGSDEAPINRGFVVFLLVELAGIEPASRKRQPLVLHA